uniref:Protein kinase domain-containing protein n=1 Tax=Ditylum brightwellii TaxID=49249 RepID=A0A6U3QC26_9STRA
MRLNPSSFNKSFARRGILLFGITLLFAGGIEAGARKYQHYRVLRNDNLPLSGDVKTDVWFQMENIRRIRILAKNTALNMSLSSCKSFAKFMSINVVSKTCLTVIRSKPAGIACATAAASAYPYLCPKAHASGKRGRSNAENIKRALVFWRHIGPIVVHYRFTQVWMNMNESPPEVRKRTWEKLHGIHAPTGLSVILKLRGLYVKIGQVLSARADFMPLQYVNCFMTLQDSVPPWPTKEAENIVREELQMSQGLNFDDVFESFGEALGSASIGQVHRAVLKPQYSNIGGYSGGRNVAIKVMHAGVEDRFLNDFKVFRWLCRVALPGWEPILLELQKQMMTEFDYKNEAESLKTIRLNMARSPYTDKIRIPEPATSLCSKNMLVMEMLEGKKLAVAIEDRLSRILNGNKDLARKVLKTKQQALFRGDDSGRRKEKKTLFHEINQIVGDETNIRATQKIIKTLQLISLAKYTRDRLSLLLDVHGHQIFLDGCFNGDPHPGNILELDCGRLGLIDYGQVRRLGKRDRLALSGVVAALGKDGTPQSEIADSMREFGFQSRDNNDEIIAKNAELYFGSDAARIKLDYATPQMYLQHLNGIDPIIHVPDAAVFVARTSFLFRGMGSLLQQQLCTAKSWSKMAELALKEECTPAQEPYRLGL